MNLKVKIGDQIELKNPLMPASGPLVGDAEKILSLASQDLGALVTKTISSKAAPVPHPCIIGGKDYIINAELWSEFTPEKWENDFLPKIEKAALKRPLFISLGYKKDEICSLIKRVEKYATAFELSTHYVGTDLKPIAQTVKAASDATEKPVFIKLSPHITDPAEFAQMVKDNGGYGIVAINSVGPTYPVNLTKGKSPLGSKDGYGWISGPVIKPISLSRIRMITQAVDIPVIGVGGIKSAEDILEFIAAGASAVQMLSAAMLYGKDLYSRILNDLPKVMKKHGFSDLTSVKGLVKDTNREINFETGYPIIDHDACTLCGLCVRNCPYYALSIEDKRVVLDKSKCFRCGLCESRCPVNAIEGVL